MRRLAAVLVLIAWSVGAAHADEELPFKVPRDWRSLPETALIETTKGPFEISFFRKEAPTSVANFQHLVTTGVYDGVAFHRYVPGFVIQGGDPTGTTKGGPGWTLPSEIHPAVRHLEGVLGWARLPSEVNPERRSNGSQFYITLSPQAGLDGFYTIFARVVRGMENVRALRQGDTIIRVRFPKERAAKDGWAVEQKPSSSSTRLPEERRPGERRPESKPKAAPEQAQPPEQDLEPW